jgi:hypothetical protein
VKWELKEGDRNVLIKRKIEREKEINSERDNERKR